jgi:hypothetical protein
MNDVAILVLGQSQRQIVQTQAHVRVRLTQVEAAMEGLQREKDKILNSQFMGRTSAEKIEDKQGIAGVKKIKISESSVCSYSSEQRESLCVRSGLSDSDLTSARKRQFWLICCARKQISLKPPPLESPCFIGTDACISAGAHGLNQTQNSNRPDCDFAWKFSRPLCEQNINF